MKLFTYMIIGSALLAGVGTQTGGCNLSDSSSRSPGDTGVSVPSRAHLAREGDGEISYIPKADGHVYAYDADDRVVLDDRAVRSGQEYTVSPDQNRITLGGKKVFEQDLKKKHAHRIYFVSDRADHDDNDRGSDSRLPHTAKRVADGSGLINYTPRDNGHVYLYDEDADRVVFDHRLRDGESMSVDPDKDRILINNKSVFDGDLSKKHSFRIYFDRD